MAVKKEFIIGQGIPGQRLDVFLSKQAELSLSRSQAKKLIEEGWVKVNGGAVKPHCLLRPGEKIEVELPPVKKLELEPENISLNIVFEDQDVIVINKPAGLVVHPAAGNEKGTLVNALLHHCRDLLGIGGIERPGIVHRLDKDTSGLMVAAKNDLAQQGLSAQFKAKQVSKEYLALVHGEVKESQGTISGKLGRHPKFRKKMAVLNDYAGRVKSREAVTHYEVAERFTGYTLLRLKLETGRTHQIRVHLSSQGYPIVGDQTYGRQKEKLNVPRQLLHAAKLGFIHPRTKQHLEFISELPDDFENVISSLRKK